jgi:hypothetical protein
MRVHANSAAIQDAYAMAIEFFGCHLDAFRQNLLDQSHAQSTVEHYVRCIGILAGMMKAHGIALAELDEAQGGRAHKKRVDPEAQDVTLAACGQKIRDGRDLSCAIVLRG